MALISNHGFAGWKRAGKADVTAATQLATPSSSLPPKLLNVFVTAPGRLSWQGAAESVTLPSPSGEFGILAGHITLTTFLDVGVLRIRVQGDLVLALIVLGGLARVEGDELTILAAGAEPVDGLELQQTVAAVEMAEADLHQAPNSSARQEAKKNLKRAYARWQAASLLLSCSALQLLTWQV
jgi:F-type H+-transporting ATPase subunit epsilon